jgi:hypothetical protein
MKLNKTELQIFECAIRKNISAKDISFLSKGLASTYLNRLCKEGFLEKNGRVFSVSSHRFARILSNLIIDDQTIINDLSNESIPILVAILNNENNLVMISKEVGLNESTIYPYLRKFLKRQIIFKENEFFNFNKELWNTLHQFLTQYIAHHTLFIFDKVPNTAKIYYETPKEIIFSSVENVEDANKTAFSVFEDFGIKLMEKEIFYRFDLYSLRHLSPALILQDAFNIASKDSEISSRRRTYCYLFYKKNINQLKKFKHNDLIILKEIIAGQGLKKYLNFPSYEEIIERCNDYDIKI